MTRCGNDGSHLLAMLRRAGVVGIDADDLALVAEMGMLFGEVAGP